MDEMKQQIQNEREFLNIRLLNLDDNKTIYGKVDQKLRDLKNEIEGTYDPKIKKLYDKDRKVWKYNLLIDGLIGPGMSAPTRTWGSTSAAWTVDWTHGCRSSRTSWCPTATKTATACAPRCGSSSSPSRTRSSLKWTSKTS